MKLLYACFNPPDPNYPPVDPREIPEAFLPCLWTDPGATKLETQAIARACRDGGAAEFNKRGLLGFDAGIPPATFCALNVEGWTDDRIKQSVAWYRTVGLKAYTTHYTTSQLLEPGSSNENYADLSKLAYVQKRVNELTWIGTTTPIVECYALRPDSFLRDRLVWLAQLAALRRGFPNCKVYAWGWGAFHSSYNAPDAIFDAATRQRYVEFLNLFDGVILWGPLANNIVLMKAIVDASW